jgi:hypothetical protein
MALATCMQLCITASRSARSTYAAAVNRPVACQLELILPELLGLNESDQQRCSIDLQLLVGCQDLFYHSVQLAIIRRVFAIDPLTIKRCLVFRKSLAPSLDGPNGKLRDETAKYGQRRHGGQSPCL